MKWIIIWITIKADAALIKGIREEIRIPTAIRKIISPFWLFWYVFWLLWCVSACLPICCRIIPVRLRMISLLIWWIMMKWNPLHFSLITWLSCRRSRWILIRKSVITPIWQKMRLPLPNVWKEPVLFLNLSRRMLSENLWQWCLAYFYRLCFCLCFLCSLCAAWTKAAVVWWALGKAAPRRMYRKRPESHLRMLPDRMRPRNPCRRLWNFFTIQANTWKLVLNCRRAPCL